MGPSRAPRVFLLDMAGMVGVQASMGAAGRMAEAGRDDELALLWRDAYPGPVRLAYLVVGDRALSVAVRESTVGLVAAATDRDPRAIVLLEASTGRPVHELAGWQEHTLQPVAFSPDGRRLLYAVRGGPPRSGESWTSGGGPTRRCPRRSRRCDPPSGRGPRSCWCST